jgi:hypothetical protein
VQYFSQQGFGRLLSLSGIEVSEGLGLPKKLEVVQEKIAQGDEHAAGMNPARPNLEKKLNV